MSLQNIRSLLEQTDDKISIFSDADLINNSGISRQQLVDLINEFLSDEEKLSLLNTPRYIKANELLRRNIVESISEGNILLQVIKNETLLEGFSRFDVVRIFSRMDDAAKMELLRNKDFIQKYEINSYELQDIIVSLDEDAKKELLLDNEWITNDLNISDYSITKIAQKSSSEEVKKIILDKYDLKNYYKVDILKSYNENSRIDLMMKDDTLWDFTITDVLSSLNIENLSQFIINHREYLKEKNIVPSKIICKLSAEKQEEFVAKIDDIGLTLNEKRQILAVLKPEVKEKIDTSSFPKEYISALKMQANEYGTIVNMDCGEHEDYKGLDDIMSGYPENFTEEQRKRFMQICEVCPNMKVINVSREMVETESTGKEYIEAEEWISSVISKLKPEYSKAQKIAVIDHEIGKKVSYSPDCGTEVFNDFDARALWKIISSGYGVCNGISRVEQYIFDRVGIDSEMIGSETHVFLKLKDLEIPLANGETVQGTTILDPTWNLTNHRFDAKPNNFFVSYEKIRENDIDYNGVDHNSHKNDEELKDATFNLDEESLRALFKSVGLTDKDGIFPVRELCDLTEEIGRKYANDPAENIRNQFLALKKVCPNFMTCKNETMNILCSIILCDENIKFNRGVVKRVYDRSDERKTPTMYVYLDSNELGKKFYVPNKDGNFIEMNQEDFTKKFECYEKDLEKSNRNKALGIGSSSEDRY